MTKSPETAKSKRNKKWFKGLFRHRMIVLLLIALQLALLGYLILSTSAASAVISSCLTVLSILAAVYAISTEVSSAYKLTWVFLILIFPLFGGLVYVFFTFQSSTHRFRLKSFQAEKRVLKHAHTDRATLERLKKNGCPDVTLINYLDEYNKFPVYDNTKVDYFTSGKELFDDMLQELKKAERYIFLEYFIIENGVFWDTVLDILEEKVKQGVDVRVLYDDVGCFLTLPADYAETLRRKGIKCSVFSPFRPFLYVIQNNRDHRKILSIDGVVAYTGGINLADEYIDVFEKYGKWKDTAVKLTGEAAWSLTLIFFSNWEIYNESEEYENFYPREEKLPELIASEQNTGCVQPFADSPLDKEQTGEQVYLSIIQRANRYVYITTPYLIIDNTLLMSFCAAAKGGVDVRIITPHIPDKRIVHDTTRSYYRQLQQAGVKIYEYTPGFIHAKSIVSDDRVASVGTVNLDYRSLNLHFECGVCFYGGSIIEAVKNDFLQTLEGCEPILPVKGRQNIFVSVKNQLLRIIAPLL